MRAKAAIIAGMQFKPLGVFQMQDYAALAKAAVFTSAALLPVQELVVVPEYRRFCEQNLCGNYGVLPACPPVSGKVCWLFRLPSPSVC